MTYYKLMVDGSVVTVRAVSSEETMRDFYGECFVGVCDRDGNLCKPNTSPELDKAGEAFIRFYPGYANSANLAEEFARAMKSAQEQDDYVPLPKQIDRFAQLLEPQKVLHPDECGIVQTHSHTLKELLEYVPSSIKLWSDIQPLPEFYHGLKRELTPQGDVVETPIVPEESKMSKPNMIETILTQAVNTVPLRHLTDFGAGESVKYLLTQLTPQDFGNLQYAKWIMDHGNSNTYDLLEALQTTAPMPVKKAYPISHEEHQRLTAYIGKINSTLIASGIDPHYVTSPEVWQTQKVSDFEHMSAFDLIKQNHPELTLEQYLADCLGRGSVVMDPNDPNPLKLDPEQDLKVLRSMIMSALDYFKDKVDESYGYYDHLSEARHELMSKQFKHVRRYAKQLVRRLTVPGDTLDNVFIDTAEVDSIGFLTRPDEHSEWSRHFTVKFVEDNWLIVER